MDVKKLIAKREFFGLSRGRIPSKAIASILQIKREEAPGQCNCTCVYEGRGVTYGSLSLSFNLLSPMNSESSWKRILTNIRLKEERSNGNVTATTLTQSVTL